MPRTCRWKRQGRSNRGSKNVVRHECPVCKVDGQPRVYSFPKTLEEIIAGLKKNQDK